MELEAQHAVADIPQARRAVLRHRLRRALDVGEQQHARPARDHAYPLAVRTALADAAAIDAIERQRLSPAAAAPAASRPGSSPRHWRRRSCRSARTGPRSSCSRASSPDRRRRRCRRSPAPATPRIAASRRARAAHIGRRDPAPTESSPGRAGWRWRGSGPRSCGTGRWRGRCLP